MDMKQVNHTELENVFNLHFQAKKPLFIHGTTGIGKSDTVESQVRKIADEKDREFVIWHDLSQSQKENLKNRIDDVFVMFDIRLASYDPSDIQGIPSLEEDVLRFMPPEWVDAICQDGFEGVVFLDEANLAPPLVQSALYQLVLDRKVGSRRISDGVYVVAAGNREGEDRANIHGMAAPLADRFGHVELQQPTAGDPDNGTGGEWTEWALENDIHEYVLSFLFSEYGEQYLFTFESDNFGGTHSFATPRSWETVSDLLTDDMTPEEAGDIASIWVGNGVGTEFEAFLELRLDADIESYLENPEKGEQLAEEPFDKSSAIMTGVAAKFRDNPEEALPKIIRLANNIPEDHLQVFVLRACRQYNNEAFMEIMTSKEKRDNLEGWNESIWQELAEGVSMHFM